MADNNQKSNIRDLNEPDNPRQLVRLADALRLHNRIADGRTEFTPDHLRILADVFQLQHPDQEKWIDYITGVTSHCH